VQSDRVTDGESARGDGSIYDIELGGAVVLGTVSFGVGEQASSGCDWRVERHQLVISVTRAEPVADTQIPVMIPVYTGSSGSS
jgi:hypothetical protein